MPTQMPCPSCKQQIGIPDADHGKAIRCPHCNATFTAPLLAQLAPQPAVRKHLPQGGIYAIAGIGLILFLFVTCGFLRSGPVTLAKYNSLQVGTMTYQDVCGIMGSPGAKTAQELGPGFVIQVYVWQNPDGSSVTATFRSYVLAAKAQNGLR